MGGGFTGSRACQLGGRSLPGWRKFVEQPIKKINRQARTLAGLSTPPLCGTENTTQAVSAKSRSATTSAGYFSGTSNLLVRQWAVGHTQTRTRARFA